MPKSASNKETIARKQTSWTGVRRSILFPSNGKRNNIPQNKSYSPKNQKYLQTFKSNIFA
jgi:hypothetical protein